MGRWEATVADRENEKGNAMGKNQKKGKDELAGMTGIGHPKEADRKIRKWLLEKFPKEKKMIGDFDKNISFRNAYERMVMGEDFDKICNCTESAEREWVFEELAKIYREPYEMFYYLWLASNPLTQEKMATRAFIASRRRAVMIRPLPCKA